MNFAQVWEALQQELQTAREHLFQRSRSRGRKRLSLELLEDRTVLTAWTPIGPAPITNGQTAGNLPVSGRVTGIAADANNANIVFIATSGGGVWKTTNATAATPTWTPLTDNLTSPSGSPLPESMGAIAETDATSGAHTGNQIIYAGMGEANNSNSALSSKYLFANDTFYGEGILVSTDGGASWTLTNAGGAFNGRTVSKIVVDRSDLTGATAYAAVSGDGVNGQTGNTGIWKTTNFGQTWTNMTAASPNNLSTTDAWSDVVIDPNNSQILFAAEANPQGATGNGVYKSSNGGTTWTLLNGAGSVNGTQDGRISLALYDDGTKSELFVSIAQPLDAGAALYKMLESTNGGTSFNIDLTTNLSNYLGGQGHYDTTLTVDPHNAQFIYAAGAMSNQGPTFSGSPLESFDGGATWQDIATDPAGNGPHTDAHAVAFDANGNLLDGNDGGIFRLQMPTDYTQPPNQLYQQQSWSSLNSNLQTTEFWGVAVDPTNGTVYGGSQDDGTEKYTGAIGWKRILAGDGGITRVDPTNSKTVYAEQFSGNLYVSKDSGLTFTPIGSNLNGNKVDFFAPYVLDSSGNIYYGSDDLNLSKNQGSSFSAIGTPGTNGFNPTDSRIDAIAVSASNNNVVYVSAGGHIFVTQNAQASQASKVTWTPADLPGSLKAGALNSLAVDPTNPGTAYAVVNSFQSGGNHVFQTTDFGKTWHDISGNLPNTPVNSVTVSPDSTVLYIGTDVGVYSTAIGNLNGNSTIWMRFGTGMPNAMVMDLEVVPSLNLLVAGTHGRGAWEIPIAARPSITVTNPTVYGGVAYTNSTSPTISGTVTDNSGTGIASVMVSINGGTQLHATVAGNTWSLSTARLNLLSINRVSVTANDNAGGSAITSFMLSVDTQSPYLTVTTPAAPGGVAYSKTSSVSFTGTAVDTGSGASGIASVTISVDGGRPIPANLSAANWYSTLILPDGTHNIVVVATDRAGNSTTNTSTLTVDTVAPTVTVTSPVVTGGIGYTNTHSPMICGTVSDGTNSSGIASVMLTIDGHAPVFATVSGGTWTYSASGLLDGNHTISVTATDKVGNTSTPASFTLQVDTVGPSVTVTSPKIANGVAYSNTAAPTISGTIKAGSNTSGISCVTLTIDGGSPVLATLTGNAWSYGATGLSEGSHTISVVATDMFGNVGPATNFTLQVDTVAPTVTVTTPTITAGTATVYNNVPLSFAGLVTDPNPSSGIASVMLSIDGNTPLAATVNGANWSYSNAVASIGNHSVCVTATDNAGNSSSYTFALVIKNNSPLGLTIPPGPLTYNAQGAPINVATGATVVDGASNFHGGTLTIGIAGGADPNDRLTIYNQGRGAGLISVVGNAVFYGVSTFSQIGTFSGGTGGAPLVFNFTTFAYTNVDASVAQALLRDIQFSNSSATPSAAPRTLQFVLIDGSHNSSGLVDVAVNVVAPQVAPTINLNTSGITYAAQSPPQLLAPAGAVTAGTAANFSGGSLIVCYNAGATAADCLQVLNVGQISVNTGCVFYGPNQIGTISGGTGGSPLVISLTTFADATATGALIRAIAFQNGSPAPSTVTRTIQFQLDDGSGGVSTPVTETVQIAAPVVSITPANSSLSYTLNSSPVTLLPGGGFSDSAATTLAGSRLIVSSSQPGDQLTIQNTSYIQVKTSPLTGTIINYFGVQIATVQGNVIHFGSNATSAGIQALLRAFVFSTTGPTGSRTVTFGFTDGYGNTGSAAVAVNVN